MFAQVGLRTKDVESSDIFHILLSQWNQVECFRNMTNNNNFFRIDIESVDNFRVFELFVTQIFGDFRIIPGFFDSFRNFA